MISALLERLTALPKNSLVLAVCTILGSVALAWLIDLKAWHKVPQLSGAKKP